MHSTHNARPVATTVAGRIIGAQALCSCGYAGEHRANHLLARADADAHRTAIWQAAR